MAIDVGGAVYADMQSAAPCMFTVTDYSAEISFTRNHANSNIGHHIYGTSVRNDKCDRWHIIFAKMQGKPYCRKHDEKTHHEHINISFDPGLNETRSPVISEG